MPSRSFNRVSLPFSILWLLRDRKGDDWASLAREFGLNEQGVGTFEITVFDFLSRLRNVGLITYEDAPPFSQIPVQGKIQLTDKWPQIQAALDISLSELSKLGWASMIVTPALGKPTVKAAPDDLFVIMPFVSALEPVYKEHIVAVAQALGLTIARADDFSTAHSIMLDIWAAITSARAIIADCTRRNPNVFYEIGLAHAVGTPVILITQNREDVPFDIQSVRYIQYENTAQGMENLRQKLLETLKTELGLDSVVGA